MAVIVEVEEECEASTSKSLGDLLAAPVNSYTPSSISGCDQINLQNDLHSEILKCLSTARSVDELSQSKVEKLDRICLLSSFPKCELDSIPLLHQFDRVLRIPVVFGEFAHEEHDADQIQQQLFWRNAATNALQLLYHAIKANAISLPTNNEEAASLVGMLARFNGSDSWTNPLATQTAMNAIQAITTASPTPASLLRQVLLNLKPLFATSLHRQINPETARKLDRPRGGEVLSETFFNPADVWKGEREEDIDAGALGCWNVLRTVNQLILERDVEALFPLLAPPLLTIIDDHGPKYRLLGLEILSLFLQKVDPVFLLRSGLNQLIEKSLTTSHSYISQVEHAPLLQLSIEVSLQLTDLLYPTSGPQPTHSPFRQLAKSITFIDPAAERFARLSALYTDAFINTWTYASEKPAPSLVVARCLPDLLERLGEGATRFLKATVPALCNSLKLEIYPGIRPHASIIELQLATIDAMAALIHCTKERISKWRGMLLTAAATCWVVASESEKVENKTGDRLEEVRPALRKLVTVLEEVCGEDAIAADAATLMEVDRELLSPLFAT